MATATANVTTTMTDLSSSADKQSATTTDKLPPRLHLDRYGFLVGYPISHSMSPLFHGTIYKSLGLNWEQFFLETTTITDCVQYLQDPQFFGAAVTMPHKVNIIPHLDRLADGAKAVGAVNTIYFEQEQGKRVLVGANTDVVGVTESFLQNIPEAQRQEVYGGRPGMVVGGGGAARAAVYALIAHLGCKEVYLVNRDKSEVEVLLEWCTKQGYGEGLLHVSTLEQAQSLPDLGAIVACVPDIAPHTPEEKTVRAIVLDFLNREHKGAILEMAYHPKPFTTLAEISQNAGWNVLLGTEAMIYQGLAQDQLWTGKALEELPVEKVKQVIAAKLNESRQH